MTTNGKSTQAAADAVKTLTDAATAQYQQYLNSDAVLIGARHRRPSPRVMSAAQFSTKGDS